ncbi:hypothetical protein [Streptomyces sp. B6B3]|uniref:hypothetical protein n=1 Tax=Streptomyces sp. B6B3 TaxID=3153570 RepID=UPI00325E0A63
MPRPPDWSSLDLDGDPTPGDPARIEALLTSQQGIIDFLQEVDDGLDELLRENSSGFVGQTADALREAMDDRVRGFVQSFRDAHQDLHNALQTYHDVMVEQQGVADGALTAAEGLDKEDGEWETQRSTATSAGDALDEAASTAATAVSSATAGIQSMLDPCEEIWKILSWIAIALIIPALIMGGPVALVALALNAAIMIKTAIDFASGKASITELILSVLGVLVPTTRGINIAKGWSALKGWAGGAAASLKGLSLSKIVAGTGHLIVSGLKWFVGVARAAVSPQSWANLAKSIRTSGFFQYVGLHFKGFGPLAVILPVNAAELGRVGSLSGLMRGFRISVFDRGLMNQYRTGAWVNGTNVIDIRAIRGFDDAGRPLLSPGGWAKYQPGGAAAARGLGSIGTFIPDPPSATQLLALGGLSLGHLPVVPTTTSPVRDLAAAAPPIGISPPSHVSLPTTTIAHPPPAGGLVTGSSTSAPSPGNVPIADLAPVQPISLYFADRGLHLGVTGTSTPGAALPALNDLPVPGELHVPLPASVVAHVPGPQGQTVGVQIPLLSPSAATTAGANVAGTAGARLDTVVLDINLGTFAPIRMSYGDNGLTVARTGAGEMPPIDVSTMPQLGEVMTVPPSGLNVGRGDLGAVAALGGLDVPRTSQITGNLGAPGRTTAGGLAPEQLALDLNVGSVPPLRLHFTDQGMALGPPDVALPGAAGRLDAGTTHTPAPQGAGAETRAGTSLPEGVGLQQPSPSQLELDLGAASKVSVTLGEGLEHTAVAVPLIRTDAAAAHAASVPPPSPATTQAAAQAPVPGASGAPAPPARQPGAGSLGDITLHAHGVAPVRISSIVSTPAGGTSSVDSTVPAPAATQAGSRSGTRDGVTGDHVATSGSVVEVRSLGTPAPPLRGDPVPTEAAPAPAPGGVTEAATVEATPVPVPVRAETGGQTGGSGLGGSGLGGSERGGSGLGGSGLRGGETPGPRPFTSGPLEGHTVTPARGGEPPSVTGPGGRPADASLTRLGNGAWLVGLPERPRVLVDDAGAHTHTVVPLRAEGGAETGRFVGVPVRNDGAAVLFHEKGAVMPGRASVVGESITVQRLGGGVDFHAMDGSPLGRSQPLPGPDRHQLMTPADGGRPYVVGPNGTALDGASTSRLGDVGWLAHRPGQHPVLVEGPRGQSYTVVTLAGRPGQPDLLALVGRDGVPYPVPRAADGSAAPGVVRTGPRGTGTLHVDEPGGRFSVFDADTGAFRGDGRNGVGMDGVDGDEFRRLGEADRQAVLDDLARRGGGRGETPVPDVTTSPLVYMLHTVRNGAVEMDDLAGRAAAGVPPPNAGAFGVPGRPGATLHVSLDPGTGRVRGATVTGDGGLDVRHVRDGDADVLHVTARGGDGEVTTVHRERWVPVADDVRGTNLRFDAARPTAAPTLVRPGPDGVPADVPGGVIRLGDAAGHRVALADGRFVAVDGTGALTHRVVPLAPRDGGPPQDHVYAPARGGGAPELRGADGGDRPRATVVRSGDTYRVTRPGADHVTSVHALDGGWLHDAHVIRGGSVLDGNHLAVPRDPAGARVVDARGGAVPGATVRPLGGDGFRVESHGGNPAVLDGAGRVSHDVVTLRLPDGTGGFATRARGAEYAHGLYRGQDQAVAGADVRFGRDGGGGDLAMVTLGRTTAEYRIAGPPGAFQGNAVRATHEIHGGSPVDGGRLVVSDPHGTPTAHLVTRGGQRSDVAVVPQRGDAFRIPAAAGRPHTVVSAAGEFRGTALPLIGGGAGGPGAAREFAYRPAGAGAGGPELRGADGGPVPQRDFAWNATSYTVTDRVSGVRYVHGSGDGRLTERTIPMHGGPLDGRELNLPADPRRPARITGDGGGTATVTPQHDGALRVQHGAHHVVLDPHTGTVTRPHVTTLTRPGADGTPRTVGYAFDRPHGAGVDPAPRQADGRAVDGATLDRLPGGDLVWRRDGENLLARFDGTSGAFRFDARRLTGPRAGAAGDHVRVHRMTHNGTEYRAYDLLDADLNPRTGHVVTSRPATAGQPDRGFRVETANGDQVWLFNAQGRVDHHLGPPDAGNVRTVTRQDGGTFRALTLSDGVGTRFLDLTDPAALRLLDGDLRATTLPHGAITPRAAGGYRIDGPPGGLRADEWRQYDARGRLTEQRINPTHRGAAVTGQYFRITYSYDGDGLLTGTWERWRGNAAPPRPGPVMDRGTVDTAGAGQGLVTLKTHFGGHVFERRPLPNGHTVDTHAPGSVTPFSNQRQLWSELDASGRPVAGGHGVRAWTATGEWFDRPTGVHAGTMPSDAVRHMRVAPQGGHILTVRDGGTLGRWHYFDAEGRQLARGDRAWATLGDGWVDRVPDPRTGHLVEVDVKTGRLAVHGVRTFRMHDLGPDGLPKADWSMVSHQGKPIGSRRPPPGGGWMETHRVADQRPPNWYRSLLSSEFRHTDSGRLGAWARDTRFQTHTYRTESTSGIRQVGLRGHTTYSIDRGGRLTAETRTLSNGHTLTVGHHDVPLPAGAGPVDRYLPWSEGAGNRQGHRTYDRGDFGAAAPPAGSGRAARDIVWVDRYADGPGDWYTPAAGRDWQVARVGFRDGTMLEYRPRAHGTGRDWTVYDHHGQIVARQDTWPSRGPGAPPGEGAVQVVSAYPGKGKATWSIPGTTVRGERHLADRNQFDHVNYFDPGSYRDFVDGRMVREHRLLGDGVTVDSWLVSRGAGGEEVWHWNKTDRDGNVLAFGGQADRVRFWFDGDRLLSAWRPGARWEDWLREPAPPPGGAAGGAGHGAGAAGAAPAPVRIQEIPKPVGGALRQGLNDAPLRVREYAPTPDTVNAAVRGQDAYRTWKEFESGSVARTRSAVGDGSFHEVESMTQQWRRYVHPDTGGATVVTDRSMVGFVREQPAGSFAAGAAPYRGSLALVGRDTHFMGSLNEFRGYERMYRQPRRADWGPAVNGESTYTPFLTKGSHQFAVEFAQEFVLDFLMNLAVYAALPGPFTGTDVAQAAVVAAVSGGLKAGVGGLQNFAMNHSTFRLGLNWLDRGLPFHLRQDDDNWPSEWAGNEFVLRWRGGTFDFFRDSIALAPLGAFLGNLAAIEAFGMRDAEGNRHEVSAAQAAAFAGAAAAGSLVGSLAVGVARTSLQNTIGVRWYHRQGVVDFVVFPMLSKLMDKLLGGFVFVPVVRDSLGLQSPTGSPPPQSETQPGTQPETQPETQAVPVLGPTSDYPPQESRG